MSQTLAADSKYQQSAHVASSYDLGDDEKSQSALLSRTATQLMHNTGLNIYDESTSTRRTGVVCTIGPASKSVETLTALMQAGLNVVRLNFSHGTHEYHKSTIANAREAAAKLGIDMCIALDTKGPEIRTGNFVEGKEVTLELGAKVRLTTDEKERDNGTAEKFFVDYKNITKVVGKGALVYIDDGLVSLRVDEVGEDFLDTTVENSGAVSNHKGVNLPNIDVDLPAISEKDKGDLRFGVEQNVDMVFASFIRKPQDVRDIRACLLEADAQRGKRIKIISKIENHEGVRNFDTILMETDGVMVARGDLGIEIPPEKVFLAQKMMISKCNIVGKPVIVATQMLESMIKNPRPTRAEASDVANAVLDGADCVMLSGETAKGKYPVPAVQMMARVCREAEAGRNRYGYYRQLRDSLPRPLPIPDTMASACVQAAFEQHTPAIVVLTNSGTTARLISKFRPPCPIVAVVGRSHAFTARQLAITAGAYPITYDDSAGKKPADDRVRIGVEYAQERKWVQKGDHVVAVHADQMNIGFANLVRVVVV